jgi:DNA-formamidopyrimidine glycosylase
MPEGPEVKIVADYLNIHLNNKEIISFEYCSKPYKIKYGDVIHKLNLHTPFIFKEVFCIGKTSFIKLNNNTFFSFHLGMTGNWTQMKEKHTHLSIKTKDNTTIYFNDTRRFGNIKLLNKAELDKKYFKDRDLLNYKTPIKENADFLIKNIKSNIEICKILLNQKFFCGVGNYLKSEILYMSKIHPHTKWGDLNRKEIERICKYTKSIITESYNHGGAELRDFKNPENDSKLILNAYGQTQDLKGNNIINDITKDNRRSYWSPNRQILKS